jgi:capsular polysaccharide biosynthesis protein
MPNFEVVSYTNALVTPIKHVFVKGKYVPTGLLTTNDDKKLSIAQQIYFYLKFRFFTEVKKVSGPCFLAYDGWSENYYHWMCEVMPRLYMMSQQYPEGRVILPANVQRHSFVTESLALLKLPILSIDTNVSYCYEQLVTVKTDPPFGNPSSVLVTGLSKQLRGNLQLNTQVSANRKIFISRAKAERRNIVNEPDITALLVKHGYEVVYTENLSFTEQVKLFAGTVSLVSLHGAGLTNIIFMPAGSKVLEIRDSNWKTNPLCYWWLANILKIKWSYNIGEMVPSAYHLNDPNFNNININYESFVNDFGNFELL